MCGCSQMSEWVTRVMPVLLGLMAAARASAQVSPVASAVPTHYLGITISIIIILHQNTKLAYQLTKQQTNTTFASTLTSRRLLLSPHSQNVQDPVRLQCPRRHLACLLLSHLLRPYAYYQRQSPSRACHCHLSFDYTSLQLLTPP